ncbi:MAG: primosomal protein N' (replication factor Y) (superfamily II helicase) [Anaerolineaceae bacterium]|nr:MAG: primosomal protein N' (replication factor Y) (superfamily II helicase) [Anaerolineaceae bacterium]
MPAYVRVAVNVPNLTGEFDYHLPPELEGRVGAGHLVTVPFGKQTVQGVVLDLVPVPAVAETKPVADLLDPLPALTGAQIELARWMADRFLAPLAAMVDLMLPAGLSQQADILYSLANPQSSILNQQSSVIQSRLLKLLAERGPLRGRQIDRHFAKVDWRKTAQYLVRSGVLTSRSILPPPSVRPKFVRTAQLAVPPQVAEAAMPELGKTEATRTRRQSALRLLMREPDAVNVSWVYAGSGCNLSDLQELAERELITLRETEIWRDPLERIESRETESSPAVELTPDQQSAWEQIYNSFSLLPSSFLLHGVTGSGKTEIYLRAAAEAIRRGKQAIILVPEIAITPQTVRRFLSRFPGQVGLLHSKLSPGERYDTWRRARLGLLKVVIGPRSALFAPLPNVGLIVADECHDSSYSQSEPPFYNAVTTAQEYASLCGAVCVIGSATPTVVQRVQAEAGGSVRLLLPKRIVNPEMPPVQIVDMRAELKSGSRGIFSRALVEALGGVLQRGEQAILFLNRRGTATYVFCRECGHTLKCPKCDSPLTLHVDPSERSHVDPLAREHVEPENVQPANVLTCHRCGYRRQFPKTCPTCGGTQIRAYGLGSEKVEAEVGALFPSARTLRWDWETTRQKDSHEIILSHFAAHRADVLVGTQMLAKGLDLPLVTLVGIVLADVGLNLPDPFTPERTFSLLTQVSGRAGRSALGGRVVLQTFQPEHYVIQAAARHDVDGFHTRELDERRKLGYPPFSRLVRLEYRHFDPVKAEAEARVLAQKISQLLAADDRRQTTLIGPTPCFFSRLAGLYRWQVILRGPEPESLVRGMKLDGWRVEVDPASLL